MRFFEQLLCRRLVRDLEATLSDLAKICHEPTLSPLLDCEVPNLHSALALLQFICTDIAGRTNPNKRGAHGSSREHLDGSAN